MVESTLSQYSEFFTIAGVVEDVIRWILFKVVWLLTYISDSLEGIMDKIYSLNHFFENKQIQAIYNSFKPVFWMILTIAIIYIAYKMVIDREFKGERIFQNFILSSMVILALPMFMTSLEKITTGSINVLNETKIEQNTTTAKTIIKDSLYDLSYLESQNFKLNGYGNNNKVATNNINSENILKIDIKSTMSSGSFLNPTHEIYGKKIALDGNGNSKVVNLEKSFFNLIQEEYYRFNIDFLSVIISLLCLVLTFILTSIKIARIIVELGFKKIFAMTLAFGDIASGQKLKAVLKDILSSFAIIFTTALLLKIYTIGTTWVGTLNANEIVKVIFMIALSIMVIDAPNIIERILGIDAGIKSGWSLLAGAYTGAKSMGGIASATNKAMKSSTDALVGAGSRAKGIYDGFKGKTLEEEMNSNHSNSNENSKGKDFDKVDGSVSNDLSYNDSKDNLSDQRENENSSVENGNDNISSGYGEYNSLSSDMNSSSMNSSSEFNSSSSNGSSMETLENDMNSSNGFDTSSSSGSSMETLESDMNSSGEFSTSSSSSSSMETLENDMNSSNGFDTSSSSGSSMETLENDMNSSNGFDTSSSSGSSMETLENDMNSSNGFDTSSSNSSSIDNGTLESSMNSSSEFNSSSSSGSSIDNGTLESSMNSSSEFNSSSSNGSSIETGTLESNINSNSDKNIGGKNTLSSDMKSNREYNPNRNETLENGLKNESKSKIDSSNRKSENIGNINKNNMSDKNILKNSSKLDTRTLGQYAKDKVVERIGSSRQGQNVKKHYQMGVKAGNKLNSSLKEIKEIKERKGK